MVDVLRQRPATDAPLVIVLDNASRHRGADLRRARPHLRAHNVYFSYLPPYSPELNAIEPVFRAGKHLDLPERRYATTAATPRPPTWRPPSTLPSIASRPRGSADVNTNRG